MGYINIFPAHHPGEATPYLTRESVIGYRSQVASRALERISRLVHGLNCRT